MNKNWEKLRLQSFILICYIYYQKCFFFAAKITLIVNQVFNSLYTCRFSSNHEMNTNI